MAVQRVSQRDVAREANVHFTTVSLALRDSPSLPKETRERIQEIAQRMGYRPDPMLTALQSYRRSAKSPGYQGIIAWLNSHKSQVLPRHVQLYRDGAQQRCEELGYKLEMFNLGDTSMTRLSNIFRARNIQGLLLAPQARNRSHLSFDWENYSAVTFGSTLSRPRLHMVTNAQYGSSRMAFRMLRSLRHRRIGFVTTHDSDERTDQNFSSAYMVEQRRLQPHEQIPMCILTDAPREAEKKEFDRWYRKYKPTVILSHYNRVADYMIDLGISFKECGVALLALSHEPNDYTGVDQNDRIIGVSAVDFLVGMIHRNERGIPATPLRLLVEGKWIEGKTVFVRNAEPPAAKKKRLALK